MAKTINELKEIEEQIITELTPYEKFLRLPKIIKRKVKGVFLTFDFDIHFNTRYNDECSIEYSRVNAFGDYESLKGLYWSGNFEECVNNAYSYFQKSSELLECENYGKY